MPALLLYLLKVNVALLLFCLGYYAILRKLTFYTLNRVYLVLAIVFSTIYPLVDLSAFVERHEKLATPISYMVINMNVRAAQLIRPVTETNYWDWVLMLFWTGVTVMSVRLVLQFWSLMRLHQRSRPANVAGHKVRLISHEVDPFSFWQSIYIHLQQHTPEELGPIIAHEQVHVKQWHSLDVLLAELSLVFYWFNPGVWLIKKAISENLEFITDQQILQQGVDAREYQYSLLYASLNTSPNAMVNHFNVSTIKKRIMMMNSKRSSAYSLTRYSFVLPAILVLLFTFGTTKAAYIKKSLTSAGKATDHLISGLSAGISFPENEKLDLSKEAALRQRTLKAAVDLANDAGISTDTPKTGGKKASSAQYMVDGKFIKRSALPKIEPNDVDKVFVFKGNEAKDFFGDKAKDGIVLIMTKHGANSPEAIAIKERIPMIMKEYRSQQQTAYRPTQRPGVGANIDSQITVNLMKVLMTKADTNRYGLGSITKATSGTKADTIAKMRRSGVAFTVPANSHLMTIKTSMLNGKDPLYVVNGQTLEANRIMTVDMNAIESINVLKDSVATALYGKKATNGVIIVTTKRAIPIIK
ncbi:TonB-dependent receptor plug domain-containing protein [Mucilaginibacter daejeonensis]|uniref:M56 family metallopeptidase n=1 Tax=Mucilaginibacter daejeonensis TaxID=398049 RepID=UPI001D1781A4|nr:M56 family metallopeptidase [Mucilaginibacter daejeonensis]UEG51823.1 TonB-dependent receptor plug domain-containing protein [Mucilaginibacter daejeonensis]